MFKMLSRVTATQLGRTGNGVFVKDQFRDLIARLKQQQPRVMNAYLVEVLAHTRFDTIIADATAWRVLEGLEMEKFEVNETSFLEDLDAFFQRRRFTAMRMFELVTPAKNSHQNDRVDLVIVTERSNRQIVNRHVPLHTKEE